MNKRRFTNNNLQKRVLLVVVVIGLLVIMSLIYFFAGKNTSVLYKDYLADLQTQLSEVTGVPIQTAMPERIESESSWATKVGYAMQSLTTTPMSIRTLQFSTPVPTREVTPEIFDCFAFRKIQGFTEINCWHGYNDGQDLIVIMMQENQNPLQTWLYMEFANETEPLWLRIPNLETNPVRITKMDGFLLTLQAENSNNVYYFDTLARQFVNSTQQVLNTATPVPTISNSSPPPTPTEIIPYP